MSLIVLFVSTISINIFLRFGNRNSNRSSSSSSDNQSFSGEGSAKGFPVTSTKGSFARHFDIPSEDSRCSSRVDSTPVDCRTLCKLPNSPVPSAQQLSTGTPSSATSQDWKIAALRREVSVLKAELNQTRINIEFFQQRELKMKERNSRRDRFRLRNPNQMNLKGYRIALTLHYPELQCVCKKSFILTRHYVILRSITQCHPYYWVLGTLTEIAFDLGTPIQMNLKGLAEQARVMLDRGVRFENVAVVLSFRSVYHTICEIKSRIRHILQISEEKERSSDTTIRDLDTCINAYMKICG
ncbi:mitochondria-eating protein [Caerostris extrusa]|uniref:Mitochondria-eating protein n=1 Tax=Caerostris extrusa TaxID=172846 RepID=A0AAV4PAD1_CAEEX|nr:mitochondria-eating protein [Caerostris extrusa]